MAEDARDPAAYATEIEAARDRLASFVSSCTEREWRAAPLDGDPRPVAVVVDHVAHAYEYLAGWISQLVAGQPVEVSSETVDTLNAQHAHAAAAVTKAEVTEHLCRSGDAISRLVAGLHAADLTAGDGMVRRLAQIAARHADDHRSDIQAALAARGVGSGLYPAARDARFRVGDAQAVQASQLSSTMTYQQVVSRPLYLQMTGWRVICPGHRRAPAQAIVLWRH